MDTQSTLNMFALLGFAPQPVDEETLRIGANEYHYAVAARNKNIDVALPLDPCLYVLVWEDGTFYVGSTKNLPNRVRGHHSKIRLGAAAPRVQEAGRGFQTYILERTRSVSAARHAENRIFRRMASNLGCLNMSAPVAEVAGTIYCPACKTVKLAGSFHVSRTRSTGRQPACRICQRARVAKNNERIRLGIEENG